MLNISKTLYCECKDCPKIFWLHNHKPELAAEDNDDKSRLSTGILVGEIARNYFGNYSLIPQNLDIANAVKETKKLIKKKAPVIAEATFQYECCLCKADILLCHEDSVSLVEVKSSTGLKPEYIDDCAFQYNVLSSSGIKVEKVSLMFINNQYERNGELDLQQLFSIVDITKEVKNKQDEVRKNIEALSKIASFDLEPESIVGPHCGCVFMDYCFRDIPQPNIFSIAGMYSSKKWELFNKGIVTFKQLLESGYPLKDKEQLQVATEVNKSPPYIKKQEIKEFLSTLTYPVYFLDFETYQQAIPLFDNVRPYQQIPFQYSLHILTQEGKLSHLEFLAKEGTDPRRQFAECLCNDIPRTACVIAYNSSFEKSILSNISDLFPDISNHLLTIRDNIIDIMLIFKSGAYYDRSMEGSYSIKRVLPALFPDDPELNYNNLTGIHNGNEAMTTFADLHNRITEEIAVIRKQLLDYCCLDTYAMVKIFKKLKEVIL